MTEQQDDLSTYVCEGEYIAVTYDTDCEIQGYADGDIAITHRNGNDVAPVAAVRIVVSHMLKEGWL